MDKVDRFLTKRQVKEITTLSFAEIDRREIRGAFPKRRRLSGCPKGRVVWRLSEVAVWMDSFPPRSVPAVMADSAHSGA